MTIDPAMAIAVAGVPDEVRTADRSAWGVAMFKSITDRPRIACAISAAVATAAVVASLIVVLTSAAPDASAAPSLAIAVQQTHGKGDRLPNRISGSACSSLGWPNYEQSCQFDLRGPARTVRIIALH